MCMLAPLALGWGRAQEARDWGLWPLVTPLLGDISAECAAASAEYVTLLNTSLHNPADLTEQQLNALQRLDSSGPVPFLQDGMLSDQHQINICDQLGDEGDLIVRYCKNNIQPEAAQWIGIPYGLATAPGMEMKCRRLDESKYCVNYLVPFPANYHGGGKDESLNFKTNIQLDMEPWGFKNRLHTLMNRNKQQANMLKNQTMGHFQKSRKSLYEAGEKLKTIDLDPSTLFNLSEMLLNKHRPLSQMVSALTNMSIQANLFAVEEEEDIPYFWIGFLISVWWGRNIGVAPFTPNSLWPYQGVCYPAACTKQDIQDNNVLFMKQIYSHLTGSPIFAFSPLLNDDGMVQADETWGTRGCTDDDKYNIEWEEEIQKKSDAQTTFIVLAIIGFFILIGTLMDVYHRLTKNASLIGGGKKPNTESGLGFQMLVAFSLVSNTEFIFQAAPKKGSNRLDCLDGIRAISMTWVILGSAPKSSIRRKSEGS